MYQSKLAKPLQKAHYYWDKQFKQWMFVFDNVTLSTCDIFTGVCIYLDRKSNPQKVKK